MQAVQLAGESVHPRRLQLESCVKMYMTGISMIAANLIAGREIITEDEKS